MALPWAQGLAPPLSGVPLGCRSTSFASSCLLSSRGSTGIHLPELLYVDSLWGGMRRALAQCQVLCVQWINHHHCLHHCLQDADLGRWGRRAEACRGRAQASDSWGRWRCCGLVCSTFKNPVPWEQRQQYMLPAPTCLVYNVLGEINGTHNRASLPGFWCRIHYVSALWPCSSHLTPLCLHFLFFKTRIIRRLTSLDYPEM